MNQHRHLGAFASVFCGIWALATMPSGAAASDDDHRPVETATAVVQAEFASLWVPGTVVSRQDARVSPEVSGRLDWLIDVGDRVEAGAPLARINDEAWRIQLRSDDAEIRRLEANVEYLRRQVDRFVRLADANSTAASEVDRLTMELRMLEQEHAAAMARRDRTIRELELAVVSAPFAGMIVERNSEVGEFARAGEPVVRIVNTTALEVVARAPVDVARRVSPGDAVSLRSDDDTLTASLRALVPAGDERSRGIEVRVDLPAGAWIVGQAVRVALGHAAEPAQVAIPRDALVLRNQQVYVFKVLDNATARQVAVRVGKGVNDLVSVDGDVGVGDQVVIRGAERLADGQAVRVLSGGALARASYSASDAG